MSNPENNSYNEPPNHETMFEVKIDDDQQIHEQKLSDNSLAEIIKTQKDIQIRMDNLENKLNKIHSILETDCKKMSDHIDFIENVYDNVKTPFSFLMNSVNAVINIPVIGDIQPRN